MANYRRGRINDAVAQELAIALGNVREPKVTDNFVSITRAEVAPDLKMYCELRFTLLRFLLLSLYRLNEKTNLPEGKLV